MGPKGRHVGGGQTGPARLLLPSVPWGKPPPGGMCPLTLQRSGLRWDLLKNDLIAVGCEGHFGGHRARAGTGKWERDIGGAELEPGRGCSGKR